MVCLLGLNWQKVYKSFHDTTQTNEVPFTIIMLHEFKCNLIRLVGILILYFNIRASPSFVGNIKKFHKNSQIENILLKTFKMKLFWILILSEWYYSLLFKLNSSKLLHVFSNIDRWQRNLKSKTHNNSVTGGKETIRYSIARFWSNRAHDCIWVDFVA